MFKNLFFIIFFTLTLNAVESPKNLAQEIEYFAQNSAIDVYNLNEIAIKSNLNILFANSQIKGVEIIDAITGDIFINAYKNKNDEIIYNNIPSSIHQYPKKTNKVKYNNEIIGTINIFYENKIYSSIGLTQEEIDWLSNHPMLKVSSEPDYAPWDFNEDGVAKGYSIDYLNILTSKLGLKVEYINDTWNNLLKKLQNKEIDIAHTMFKNEDRDFILFSEPYKKVINAIFVHQDDDSIESVKDLANKNVSITKGDSTIVSLLEEYPSIKIVEPEVYIDAIKNVAFKKSDATILELGVANYLIKEYNIPNIKIANEVTFKKSKIDYSYRFGVRSDYKELVSILNKTMKIVTTQEIEALDNKWINSTNTPENKIEVQLTTNEKDWLEKHPNLKFAGDPNWLPIEGFNEQGKYIGIVAEYLKIIEDTLKIKFDKIVTKDFDETIELAKNGGVDLISETTDSDLRTHLSFTNAYLQNPLVIIMNESANYVENLNSLKGKKIAVINGYGYLPKLFEAYPEIEFTKVKNIQDGLMAVSTGKIDVFVATSLLANYHISLMGLSNVKIVGKTDVITEVGLGVRKDYAPFVNILNKVIAGIDEEQKQNIFQTWVKAKYVEEVDYSLIWKLMGSAAVILLGVIYWNRRLQSVVNEKTFELKQLIGSFDKYVIASKTDINGVINYVSDAFCEISGYTREELIGQTHNIVHTSENTKTIYIDLWQTISSKHIWRGQFKNKKKNGDIYWVDTTISPEFDKNGKLVGYSSIQHDITDKKSVEALSIEQAEQMAMIERSNRLLNGRENKMIALKQEVNECKIALGEKPIYSTLFDEADVEINIETIEIEDEKDLKKLLDVEQLQNMMESFYNIMHIPLAIIDLKGIVLVQSKWQRACTDFHRANEESCKRCIESDIDLASKLNEGENFTSYKCANGLIDCASPIIIEGEHVANFFIGQFLINEPDIDFFSAQAKKYNYNVDEYLESIRDIPILDEKTLPNILNFLTGITNVVTSISIEKIKAQKNEKHSEQRTIQIQKAQLAALNLAEDAEQARKEIENYKEHLEVLVDERTKDLQKSQEQLSFALSAANMGTWQYDVKENSLIADENGKRLYGLENIELDGTVEQWFTFIHPDDIAPLGQTMQETMANQRVDYKTTFRVIMPQNQETHHIMSIGKFTYGENNEPLFASGLVWDITDIKVAQEKIEENRLFLNTLLDSQEQLIITTDGKTLVSANKTFKSFYDVESVEEFQSKFGNCICDTFCKEAPAGYLQIMMGEQKWIDYVIERASSGMTHKAMIIRDGKEYIFSASGAKLPGETGLKAAVFTDITELENQKKQIELILDNILLPVLITSKKTRNILYANSFAEKKYEISSEEMIGRSIDFVYTTDTQRDIILQEFRKNGYIQGLEQQYKTNSGAIFDGLLSLVGIVFNGEDAMIGMVTDITEQKLREKELKTLHKHTQDSIEYASLIQGALIPEESLFENYFQDYFAIWNPKDIVGGDIYLFEELRGGNEALLMVIDCTGHGVPGAFVTMLVKALERQVIAKIENDISIDVSPAWILSYFNRKMKTMLHQESEESISNAGFDGGIIYYNKKEKIIKYAGAETGLYYFDDALQTIKGDRQSIGYKKSNAQYEFKEHIINVKDNMQFYITTDGFIDQNGGEKGFPLGKKKFTQLIEQKKDLPFKEQKDALIDLLTEYQGDEERNDDVTVIGFKI